MSYFSEIRQTLGAAIGPKRYSIIPAVKIAVLIIGAAVLAVMGWQMGTVATVITATILVLGFCFWSVLDYAIGLRRQIKPQFEVRFPASGMGIVPAIVRESHIVNGQIAYGPNVRSRYVRIQIDGLSSVTIKGCVAGIIGLEKRKEGETSFDSVALPQTIYLTTAPFDVYPNMPCTVDFLVTNEQDEKLNTSPGISWPLILEDVFNDKGSYRFKINVNGGDVSKAAVVEINWNGHWDAITGQEVT